MTSPTTDTSPNTTDGARGAGRSAVELLRDGGYATIGATDAAVAYVRRLGERAEQARHDLPNLATLPRPDQLSASLRELGSTVEKRVSALAGRGLELGGTVEKRVETLAGRGRAALADRGAELGGTIEARFGTLAGRGREVVASLQRGRPTRDAVARTEVARSQVKAASTSVRKAGEAGGEATVAAAAAVGDDAAGEYESLTVERLRDLARERGIQSRHSMNKAELVAALRGA